MPRAKKVIVESTDVVVVPVKKPRITTKRPQTNHSLTTHATTVAPQTNHSATAHATTHEPQLHHSPNHAATAPRPRTTPVSKPLFTAKAEPGITTYVCYEYVDYEGQGAASAKNHVGDIPYDTLNPYREVAQRFGSGYYRLLGRRGNGTFAPNSESLFFFVPELPEPQTRYSATDETDEWENEDSDTIEDDRPSMRELHLAEENAAMKAEARVRREYEARQPVASSGNRLSEIREMLAFAKELQPPVSSASRPAKSLVEQLQELREVEKALGINRDEARNNPSDPTLAILKMLVDDPDSVNSVAGKVRGLFTGESPIPEKDNSWNDVLMNLADNVFSSPMFGDAVGGFLGNIAAYVPGIMERFGVAPANGNQNTIIDDPEAIPAAVPAQIEANRPLPPKGLNPQEALQVIFNELSQNKPVDRAANIARQLLKTSYAPMIQQIIQTPVAQLLTEFKNEPQFASFAALPHVEQWLTALQTALKDEVPMLDEPDVSEAESEDAS